MEQALRQHLQLDSLPCSVSTHIVIAPKPLRAGSPTSILASYALHAALKQGCSGEYFKSAG